MGGRRRRLLAGRRSRAVDRDLDHVEGGLFGRARPHRPICLHYCRGGRRRRGRGLDRGCVKARGGRSAADMRIRISLSSAVIERGHGAGEGGLGDGPVGEGRGRGVLPAVVARPPRQGRRPQVHVTRGGVLVLGDGVVGRGLGGGDVDLDALVARHRDDATRVVVVVT